MEIGPIWRAMMRNKTGAILIALQIAVTMAIMVNAISIMQERGRMMSRPSGIDEQNIFAISSVGFAENFNERVTIEEDLAVLRSLPGVVNVTQSNSVPLSGGGWNTGLQTEPGEGIDGPIVAVYMVDEHALDTLGLNLIAGENFSATDIGWRELSDTGWDDKAIITRAAAKALFPDVPDSALGNTVYVGDDEPVTITGIIEQMQAPWNGWEGVERVMLVPSHPLFKGTYYIIRAEPGMRDSLMPQVEELLAERNKDRIVRSMRSMDEIRERSYSGDAAMIKILTFTIVLLIAVTSLGIVGLACAGRKQNCHPALFYDREFHHQSAGRFNRCSPDRWPQHRHDRNIQPDTDCLVPGARGHVDVTDRRTGSSIRAGKKSIIGTAGSGNKDGLAKTPLTGKCYMVEY